MQTLSAVDCAYLTGAGSGIGRAVAARLIAQGASLALFDRSFSHEVTQQFTDAAQASGVQVRLYEVDVTELPALTTAIAQADAAFGSPDLVLHCAGINRVGTFDSLPEDQFETVVRVNLIGTHNLVRAVLPVLKQGVADGKQPRLVMVASMAGIVGNFGYASYGASKFGVVGLAQVLRMELKPQGIRVQVICPPEVDTPMVHEEHKTVHPITLKLKLLAGSLPLDYAVDSMLRGMSGNRFLIIPGVRAKMTYWMTRLVPTAISYGVVDSVVKRMLKK